MFRIDVRSFGFMAIVLFWSFGAWSFIRTFGAKGLKSRALYLECADPGFRV